MNTIPRRYQLDKLTPAEVVIYNAILMVDELEADVRLTDAIIKLNEAKHLVADFVDEQLNTKTS